MVEALKDLAGPRQLTQLYRARAEYTYTSLLPTACRPIKSHGGFYLTLDCEEWIKSNRQLRDDARCLANDILTKAHVATVSGTDFGLPYTLRLSFCSERYNEAVDRLVNYFGSGRRSGRGIGEDYRREPESEFD
jgi:aspartate/methionine/tyrosine aminotransferase